MRGRPRERLSVVGTRILTVEDDERIRTSVRLALEDEGWEVDEATNGEDAIARFVRSPADVVLIDIMLPGIDGFDVCRAIRRQSDVPIIMVTARADTHDVVAGLEAGADDYLTKPFVPKELSARIRGDHLSATISASNAGRVFSREALLERVWGHDYFGDGRLVDVHIRRLRTKVEADPASPRYVVTVRGLGYKLQP